MPTEEVVPMGTAPAPAPPKRRRRPKPAGQSNGHQPTPEPVDEPAVTLADAVPSLADAGPSLAEPGPSLIDDPAPAPEPDYDDEFDDTAEDAAEVDPARETWHCPYDGAEPFLDDEPCDGEVVDEPVAPGTDLELLSEVRARDEAMAAYVAVNFKRPVVASAGVTARWSVLILGGALTAALVMLVLASAVAGVRFILGL